MTIEDEIIEDPVVAEGAAETDIEARARAQGWFPEEEWDEERGKREGKRKPRQFSTAGQFLERVGESAPIMRERLDTLTRENVDLKNAVKEVKGLVHDIRETNKSAMERARADERQKVLAEQRKAAEDGDLDRFDKLQNDLSAIDKQEREELVKKAEPVVEKEVDPLENLPDETKRWLKENTWFRSNAVLNAYMIECHGRVKKNRPAMGEFESLDAAKDEVMRRFPEMFGGKPAQRRAAGMGSDALRSGEDDNTSIDVKFASLPAEAKTAYERMKTRFASMRPPQPYTKQEYLKEYGV